MVWTFRIDHGIRGASAIRTTRIPARKKYQDEVGVFLKNELMVRTPKYPATTASSNPPSGRSNMAQAMESPHHIQRPRPRVCQSPNSQTAKFKASAVKKISNVSVSAAAA